MNDQDTDSGMAGNGESVLRARKAGRALCWSRAPDAPEIGTTVFPDSSDLLRVYDAPTHDSRSSRLTPAAAGQGALPPDCELSFVSTVTVDNNGDLPGLGCRTLLLQLPNPRNQKLGATCVTDSREMAPDNHGIWLPIYRPEIAVSTHSASEVRSGSTFWHPHLRAALATNFFLLAILLLEIGIAFSARRAGWYLPPAALSGLAIWLGTPIVRAAAGLLIAASLLLVVLEWRGNPQPWTEPQRSFLRF